LETVAKRLYEALFLVDSSEAAADWKGVNEHIKKVFERNDAEIVSIRKWDERPLAYEIMGKNRGTYILVYFNSPTGRIASIERDSQLSERIMRVLILRTDHATKEDMEKETPAMMVERQTQKQVAPEVPSVADYVEAIESEDNFEEERGPDEQTNQLQG
jgi:small subunit ribosomal protein S6